MGYVGNQQTEGFSKIPPKQDLTGATGSTLTLSHAVSSPESIDLFINNVRQEPTESYTIDTNGTTVNLVGYTVAATDDIYVVYNSLAQQTSTHPSNQALQATSGAFSSNVDVGGSLFVDTIKEGTGTNTAISIDSTGFASGLMVNAGRQSLASSNGYTWTGIPSTARKILVVYRLFFTQGASADQSTILRVGDGSIVTSGYEGISSYVAASSAGSGTVTDGFFSFYWATGTQNQFGQFELSYLDGNAWVCSGQAAITEAGGSATTATVTHSGYINLTGALDRVELAIKDGTTTYNANSEAVLYYMG